MAIRDLGEHIACLDQLWVGLTRDERRLTRNEWADQGWQTCAHRNCPPWNCQITNHPPITWPGGVPAPDATVDLDPDDQPIARTPRPNRRTDVWQLDLATGTIGGHIRVEHTGETR